MIDFGKWPRLVVTGQRVTREQANEILVRTDPWSIVGNDPTWEQQLRSVAGVQKDDRGYTMWQSVREFRAAIHCVDLEYLHNDRIYSAWIGGPHGWCDWDGRIGCGTHNIGKWPSCEAVTGEWERIAEAFPYLVLDAQVIAEEGEGQIAAQWAVRDGKAALVEPAGFLPGQGDLTEAGLLARFTNRYAERGVTLDRLTEALVQVRGR